VGSGCRENDSTLIIRDLESLHRVSHGPRMALASGGVKVNFANATEAENGAWARRLGRHLGACGCETGAAGVALVLLAFIVSRLVLRIPISTDLAHEAGAWVALAMGAAVTGKLGGLAYSRAALRGLEREIVRRVGVVQ
jgi:hypothetical protein